MASPNVNTIVIPEWQVKETELWIKSYPPSYNYLLSLFKDLKVTFNKKYISRIYMSEPLDGYNPYQFQDLIKKFIGTLEKRQRDKVVEKTKDELAKTFIPRVLDTAYEETKADLEKAVDFGFDYILIGAGILAALYFLKN